MLPSSLESECSLSDARDALGMINTHKYLCIFNDRLAGKKVPYQDSLKLALQRLQEKKNVLYACFFNLSSAIDKNDN